jgi:hypothetical protein
LRGHERARDQLGAQSDRALDRGEVERVLPPAE